MRRRRGARRDRRERAASRGRRGGAGAVAAGRPVWGLSAGWRGAGADRRLRLPGRRLGERLLAEGWAVRGTSRREEGLAAIETAGIEPALADPGRLREPSSTSSATSPRSPGCSARRRGAGRSSPRCMGRRSNGCWRESSKRPCAVSSTRRRVASIRPSSARGREAVEAAGERWRIPDLAVLSAMPDEWAAPPGHISKLG